MRSSRISTKALEFVPGICVALIVCIGSIAARLQVRHHSSALTIIPLLLEGALLIISVLCFVKLHLSRSHKEPHS